jgi:hypothetical protein
LWNVVLIVAHVASPLYIIADPRHAAGQAGQHRCIQLSEHNLCLIFGSPLRPKVCASLQPSPEMCLTHRDEAITWLLALELATAP